MFRNFDLGVFLLAVLPVLLALALLELLPVQLSVYMYMLVLHLHIENLPLQPLQSYSYNQVRM